MKKKSHVSLSVNNSAGFSLLGVLVSIGIISILFSALADMIVLSGKAQKNHLIRTEFDQLVDSVRRAMDNEISCSPALAGSDYRNPLVVRDPVDPSRILAESGMRQLSGWTLKRIEFANVQQIPGQDGAFRASIWMEAAKNPKIVLGAPTLTSRIDDIYFHAPSGAIEKCFGSDRWFMTAEANCRMLGGTWKGDKPGAQCIVFGHKS